MPLDTPIVPTPHSTHLLHRVSLHFDTAFHLHIKGWTTPMPWDHGSKVKGDDATIFHCSVLSRPSISVIHEVSRTQRKLPRAFGWWRDETFDRALPNTPLIRTLIISLEVASFCGHCLPLFEAHWCLMRRQTVNTVTLQERREVMSPIYAGWPTMPCDLKKIRA